MKATNAAANLITTLIAVLAVGSFLSPLLVDLTSVDFVAEMCMATVNGRLNVATGCPDQRPP